MKFKVLKKNFLWQFSQPKINHKTLCNTFDNERLKIVDVKIKVISVQCSWIRKL